MLITDNKSSSATNTHPAQDSDGGVRASHGSNHRRNLSSHSPPLPEGAEMSQYLAESEASLTIHKEGKWVDVETPSGALLVNLGAMIQAMSNDEYKSALYLGLLNEETDRLSLWYFFDEATISSLNYKLEQQKRVGSS
ncbi:protein DMR6-LIKE OXYGENASE 1 [Amborella trichopoda]|uniref:Isopenicillin N synthase-like Fe(2+) 2OG dioxygenase domain-containing protein n=1 Tax=Amborella trichopoda TaxID=13333 RepID=W1PL55_AMBTC|nr:protein DMR6-LIKE OXYGENASE 1 [Amborella trichopoda]ERN08411.1 hypothetical protein AMTR_s00148p00098190 [Amborella trichopoda]|eukprot:XP_006846830.1 protein DMR6-LIKE OXYGENASE 1 [Amborella trichopoda]